MLVKRFDLGLLLPPPAACTHTPLLHAEQCTVCIVCPLSCTSLISLHRIAPVVVLQAKRAEMSHGNGFLGSSKRCLFAKAGTAVQNPEVPLTRSTTEYKHLQQNHQQKKSIVCAKEKWRWSQIVRGLGAGNWSEYVKTILLFSVLWTTA